MLLKHINTKNFYFNLFERNRIPSIYHSIITQNDTEVLNETTNHKLDNEINSIELVPNYLTTNTQNTLIRKQVFQKHGYAANLNDSNSIEDYIAKYCNKKFRNNIKRSVKRLELSFNINYKMFFGNISNDEYKYFMNLFHEMLNIRFQQLNVRNISLENWEHYNNIAFNAINNKEASLFIIFNKEEPIAFSLNFHFNNIFYSAIPTFNLDYYKFTLGNVVNYKSLEWCINNNFNLFDLGYGGFENKINWCNTKYDFEHHIIYNHKNIIGGIYAEILKNKYKLTNYLISKNVNVLYKNVKDFFTNNTNKLEKPLIFNIDTIKELNNADTTNLIQIDYNDKAYTYLKKSLYDFLYSKTEKLDDITLYKVMNQTNTYLIKGKSNILKIAHS
tara:strand:- start:44332 stop:45495 length:1164 start_codon:yes stop_codon:yes gene_type:complete